MDLTDGGGSHGEEVEFFEMAVPVLAKAFLQLLDDLLLGHDVGFFTGSFKGVLNCRGDYSIFHVG